MGDHCEIRKDPFAKVSQQEESQNDSRKAATVIALLITTVLLLAIFTAAFLDVRKKKAANINKGVTFKGPKFTIDDSDSDGCGSLPTPAEHRSARDLAAERESDNTNAVTDVEQEGYSPETELV